MFFHYLKIAYRNHSKHKIQSITSLLSLAIAFACVSLAGFWNNYEQTYDSFLPDYERIYKIANIRSGETTLNDEWSMPLPAYLMENYAELDKACGVSPELYYKQIVINDQVLPSSSANITPEAVEMFDIQWIEGNRNMESWKENEVAVSEQMARKICGKDSPLGLKFRLQSIYGKKTGEYQIVAIFKTRPKHSNFTFDILGKLKSPSYCETYVQFKPKVDTKLFLQKLMVDSFKDLTMLRGIKPNVLTPLKKVHYTYPEKRQNVRMDDVKLFTGAAALLSICALLNYLTLFVSRLRNRGRDIALRTICGSTSWQMGILLMVEYLLLLLGALFFSIVFIELVYGHFVELAQLEIDRLTIYTGCSYLLLFILVLATLFSLIPILYFKRKTLRIQMESVPVQSSSNRFRIAGVSVQLFISLLFIFCATIMIKQVHFLIHDDIHIERKNIASLRLYRMHADQIMDILRQIPSVTDMVIADPPLFPFFDSKRPVTLTDIEDKEDMVLYAQSVRITSDIARFYGLKMKEGDENFDLANYGECFINETLAKQLGFSNPIGKTFHKGHQVIKGVIYDYAYQSPSEPIRAVLFGKGNTDGFCVGFKYTGDFAVCKAAIEKTFEGHPFSLDDGETVYKNYLISEINLLKLLNIITAISVLIALFGVYALILQECERQRKNIAIRKVYGAQVKDILMMFFKQYMLQVVIAAAFAFPIGYALMKRWLENYSRQTSIGIEVFLGIFIGMAFLVMLCIGWHVWRAANENPATAVKKE